MSERCDIQIKDNNGNVLKQPYLRLAQINYDSKYKTTNARYHLNGSMNWDKTPEGRHFYAAVNRGHTPPLDQCSIDALNEDAYQWCRLPIPEGYEYVQPTDRVGVKPKGYMTILKKEGTRFVIGGDVGSSNWGNELDYIIPIITAKAAKKPAKKKPVRKHLGFKYNDVKYDKDNIGYRSIEEHISYIERLVENRDKLTKDIAKLRAQSKLHAKMTIETDNWK